MSVPRVAVVIPHWSYSKAADDMLGRCVASFVGVGQATTVVVVSGGPLPTGGSSIGRNINAGLYLARDHDYLVVTNNDVVWEGPSLLHGLCKPGEVTTPRLGPSCQAFHGSIFCVPSDVLRRAGPFDERFDGYYEDEDFALRLRRIGVPTRCITECRARHEHGGGSSIGQLDAGGIMAANAERFRLKWGEAAQTVAQEVTR